MNSGLRRLLIGLMGLMALMLPGTLAAAQDLSSDSQDLQSSSNVGFEGSPVSRIDIAVRPSEDPAQIRALIRQEPGKPLSMDAIRSSVAALRQTGKFTQVQVSLEPQASGLRVLFILQPVYNVGLISFPGATKTFPYTRLLQAANVPSISSFVPDYVSDEEQRLLAFFVSEGFFAARIHARTQTDDVHRLINIIFDCDLHARAKISDVRVQGVSADQAAEVQKRLSRFWATFEGVSLKPGTTYSRGRIEKSLEHLRSVLPQTRAPRAERSRGASV